MTEPVTRDRNATLGLTSEDAARALLEQGKNEIAHEAATSPWDFETYKIEGRRGFRILPPRVRRKRRG
jgi:hypothetical protein